MQTKIGISAGIIGAAAYFLGLVGGWIPVLLIAGYVLIAETNQWLRMSVVKAVAVCIFFAIIVAFINFIPEAIRILDNAFSLFDSNFSIVTVSRIATLSVNAVNIVQKFLLLMMGFSALNMNTISFGAVDKLIAKHMQQES